MRNMLLEALENAVLVWDFMMVLADVRRHCNEEEAELFVVIPKLYGPDGMELFLTKNSSIPILWLVGRSNSWNLFKRTKEYRDVEQGPAEISENEKWSGPSCGKYKVNWDIATDVQMKCMGLGVIIRDEMGRVATALSKTLNSLQDPTFGEALGARGVVEFAKQLGFNEIILEGDSKQVVTAISSNEQTWCKFGHIVGDILEVLKTFRCWDIGHIKRTANGAAHGLAKAAVKNLGERIWLEEIPSTIYDIVTIEQFALSS
jgi:ribonuclease HI